MRFAAPYRAVLARPGVRPLLATTLLARIPVTAAGVVLTLHVVLDLHRLQYFDHRDQGVVRGWRSVHVTDGDHPYMGKWWVPGLQIGYEHTFVHQVADFLEGVAKGEPAMPDFRDALRTQYVCDAVLQSAKEQKWVAVNQG